MWEARSSWKNIGRELGLSDGTISSIDKPKIDDSECLHEVLRHWMHSGDAKISNLLSALENKTVDRKDIADAIRSLDWEDKRNVGL